ncbi:TetR/AcrR family transcriptional regulator [Brachybacterium saurashtrense]|uniref:TetR/AcrR family transcriptional regulator n=1 Tax=Brachybacterium saurashtrense TaxID=556288 RepID=A0A345YRS2_9MICO|nr:TetR/AcrR family transcriptional regulator [Brachybacterium saurashtrense]AXK46624.1 TetR/AcrR family transcriptional regulator [Brachybacterium saurashtrense]RRR20769.1 TetR/AcrR family transcriptional regulator [Brachybacterium saurashtrense]
MVPQIGTGSTPGRADRARNRAQLVSAARDVIHEQGVDAPLSTIADRADLSPATLYRHFPNRAGLLAAVYESEIDRCGSLLDHAVDADGAGAAIFRTIREFASIEAEQPGIMTPLIEKLDVTDELAEFQTSALAQLESLIARARRERSVRADLDLGDIRIILTTIRAVSRATPNDARAQALRAVELFERGCRRL